jgi:copper chaperone NosL
MRTLTLCLVLLAGGCAVAPSPARLDPANDQCRSCRMTVSAVETASQVVAPYQEPAFFDDLGCLERFLAAGALPAGAHVFVADHRTGEWIPAGTAIFTRLDAPAGAMGSPFVAHASTASRDADAGVAGVSVSLAEVLPSLGGQGGGR